MVRVFLFVVFILFMNETVYAQKQDEQPTSSATDPDVRIHKGRRVRATSASNEFKPVYKNKKSRGATNVSNDFKPVYKNRKSKGVANVVDSKPRVQRNTKRQQKQNNRMRIGGGN